MKYTFYKALQDYVHTGHLRQKKIIYSELETHKQFSNQDPTVLELACGGGNLAPAFPAKRYLGIDLMPDRIAEAKKEFPEHEFRVCDTKSSEFEMLIGNYDFIFCHGLLHHIDDDTCRWLIQCIRDRAKKPTTFLAIEPVLEPFWRNPLGFFLAKMDDGRYVRTPQSYQVFFEGCDLRTKYLSYPPRWFVNMEAYSVKFARQHYCHLSESICEDSSP